MVELPPRARRMRCGGGVGSATVGTTSACAENTAAEGTKKRKKRNYLRVRGEYHHPHANNRHEKELPPRARRIHINFDLGEAPVGTTSACAENTHAYMGMDAAQRNYLRVRGEYYRAVAPSPNHQELPPRARRIRRTFKPERKPFGTTSACAENTGNRFQVSIVAWNYLCVRGEYPK